MRSIKKNKGAVKKSPFRGLPDRWQRQSGRDLGGNKKRAVSKVCFCPQTPQGGLS